RDEELQTELAHLGLSTPSSASEEVEGLALAVLSSVAYPDAAAITRALERRLGRYGRLTEADCWTALRAATPSMAPALREAAEQHTGQGSVAVFALLELVARSPELAPEVWSVFASLDPRAQFGHLGNVTEWIDLRAVGDYVTARAVEAF